MLRISRVGCRSYRFLRQSGGQPTPKLCRSRVALWCYPSSRASAGRSIWTRTACSPSRERPLGIATVSQSKEEKQSGHEETQECHGWNSAMTASAILLLAAARQTDLLRYNKDDRNFRGALADEVQSPAAGDALAVWEPDEADEADEADELDDPEAPAGELIQKYDIGRILGEGTFGLVFEAKARDSDRKVALKQISKAGARKEAEREMSTLRAIHAAGGHENIASVLDIFEDPAYYFFALELVSGGEMFEHLVRNGPYSEATAAGFMRELAAALQFLHSLGIVHADLKPENLMLSSWDLGASKLKVVDFGSALRVGTSVNISRAALGTSAYLPPEALLRPTSFRTEPGNEVVEKKFAGPLADSAAGKQTEAVLVTPALDMWSVGCILYIMLSGAHPFDPDGIADEADVVRRVRAGKVPLAALGDAVSDSAKDLIAKLMARNPEERLSADEMLQHQWIRGHATPESPLEGSDERLAKFREVLSQKLETGVVSMLVAECMGEGPQNFSRGYTRSVDTDKTQGLTKAVDVVKNAYAAFDRRGKGRIDAKDIARFLEEQGTEVSPEEKLAVNEALSVGRDKGHPSRRKQNGSSSSSRAHEAPESTTDCASLPPLPLPPQPPPGTPPSLPSSSLEVESKSSLRSTTTNPQGAAVVNIDPHHLSHPKTPTARAIRDASDAAVKEVTLTPASGTGTAQDSDEGNVMAPSLADEEAGLDMSDFQALLEHLESKEYRPGHYVFREGDSPDDGLYFITEGRVDVLVKGDGEDDGETGVINGRGAVQDRSKGDDRFAAQTRVASMGPGDFFGEGGVVSGLLRGASIRAATPLKVINVKRKSCTRLIGGPGKTSSNLRQVALSRALFRAKNVVRAIHCVTHRKLVNGETLFHQGEMGQSLYTVSEGELDVVKEHKGIRRTVARLPPGSYFGEMALMTSQPRSASVVCVSPDGCLLDEIRGDDFAHLLMARPKGFRRDVTRMLRARQFRHAVYKLLTELGPAAAFTDEELRQVFDKVDTSQNGRLSLSELTAALNHADPQLDESAAEEIMVMLDLGADGSVTFEEFLKVIRWDP